MPNPTAMTPVTPGNIVSGGGHHGYVDWAAIIGGAVFASAISLLFLSFGTALGLSITSVRSESGASLVAFAISAALWLIWVEVSGFFAGGYLAGRLRRRVHNASEDEIGRAHV